MNFEIYFLNFMQARVEFPIYDPYVGTHQTKSTTVSKNKKDT